MTDAAPHHITPAGRAALVRSFVVFDAIAAVFLVMLLAVVFASAIQQYAHARRYNDARRLARLTAENELHRIRAGLSAHPVAGTSDWRRGEWPGLELRITAGPAEEPWRGFTLVTVDARRDVTALGWVQVSVSAYIPAAEAQP